MEDVLATIERTPEFLKDDVAPEVDELQKQMRSAIENNDIPTMTSLVDQGAVLPSIVHVCKLGHVEVARYLLEHGAEVTHECLHAAVHGGHVDMLRLLVTRGADVNHMSSSGWTVMHSAARRGDVPVLRYLLEELQVNMYVHNKKRTSLLHTAANSGHLAALEYLVSRIEAAGDNVREKLDVADIYGLSTVSHAALQNHQEIIKYLHEKHAVNVKRPDETSLLGQLDFQLLHLLCTFDDLTMIRTLVEELGVDVNTGSTTSVTPLHVACFYNRTKVIDYLLERGADPACTVQFASVLQSLQTFSKLLLESTGRTPYTRIISRTVRYLRYLVDYANIDVTPYITHVGTGHEGHEPLEVVSDTGMLATVKVGTIRTLLAASSAQGQLDIFRRHVDKINSKHEQTAPVTK